MTRQQVADGFLTSLEYQTKLVTSYYGQFLQRAPDPVGLTGWINALKKGTTDEQVITGFLASTEFWDRFVL